MKVVYIAGPIRALDGWTREQNIRRAEELAYKVWKLGAAAVCVHAAGRFFDQAIGDEEIILGDLEILSRCDAVLLAPGWQWSSGTLKEIDKAQEENIPVFGRLEHLKSWLMPN
jgi:hypothetical protein